jgi:hypothetical protein
MLRTDIVLAARVITTAKYDYVLWLDKDQILKGTSSLHFHWYLITNFHGVVAQNITILTQYSFLCGD